jgi:hypothetical protein
VARPDIEVADIFRAHGPAFRRARAGHLSLGQLKVMSAIERCRSGALGGHALRCAECGHLDIAYNSCRNRHCPKCQGAAARHWLAKQQAELLPVEYFHVVFTVPSELADLAFHNPALVYDLMFRAAADTVLTIGADPKHLGAHLGITAVLHTWGSALTHHPHLHCIIPAGGIALDGQHWQRCRPGFFLPVRVLSRLFRRRLLQALDRAWRDGQVKCFGDLRALTEPGAFTRFLARLRKTEWVVYAKAPFAGPGAVLAYLARYTHRVAISNARRTSSSAGSSSTSYPRACTGSATTGCSPMPDGLATSHGPGSYSRRLRRRLTTPPMTTGLTSGYAAPAAATP